MYVEAYRKRHFAVTPHEVDQADFREWLPEITEKYDIYGGANTTCCGDQDGDVYTVLRMFDGGICRTKVHMARYPFNPGLTIINLMALARMLRCLGRDEEAQGCFRKAVKEAQRLNLHMLELMVLCDQGAPAASASASADDNSSDIWHVLPQLAEPQAAQAFIGFDAT